MRSQLARDSIQSDALWKEYDFVSSLVPLYRGFEMHAMQLAIGIFTAASGFAAAAIVEGNWEFVYFLGALLPWPLALVLLVVATMEMRLVRASRWINSAVAPTVLWEAGPSEGLPVMRWEAEPNRYLTGSLEKFRPLTEAWTYAAVIGAPGVLGGVTGLIGAVTDSSQRALLLAISLLGLIALVGMALTVAWISRTHEERRESPEKVASSSPAAVAREEASSEASEGREPTSG